MEKLNRALCELGYSFSTVIVIVIEILLSLLKLAIIESGKPHPPSLIVSLIEKEFPAKSTALVWVAFEIGKR